MPATSLTDEQWREVLASQVPQIPHPTLAPPEPSFVERMSEGYHPWGLGKSSPMINGHFVGESSPATWNPMLGGMSGGNPATAPPLPQDVAAANLDAPTVAPTPAGPPPPPEMAGRVSNAMGASYRAPLPSEQVLHDFNDYSKALSKVTGLGSPNQELGNTGLGLALGGTARQAAGKKAEAVIEGEGLGQLADLSTKKGNIIADSALEEGSHYDSVQRAVSAERQKAEEDIDWLRKNYKVDPYRKFKTNAGAGALALLGTTLMGVGAGLSRDNSLEWTKQVTGMLEREADAQLRSIKNKQFAASEAGRNVQRILDTSKDMYEARQRIVNQNLAALGMRAEAIKSTTESKAVKERAEQFQGELEQHLGKVYADMALRREGIQSQENQARLAASTAARQGDISLILGLAGNDTQSRIAQGHMMAALAKPVRDQLNEVDKNFGAAEIAGRAFLDALDRGADGATLNKLAEAYVATQQKFLTDSGGASAGDRKEIAAYGWPTSFDALLAKGNRFTSEAVRRNLEMLERARHDRKQYITDGFLANPIPPSNSVYHGK